MFEELHEGWTKLEDRTWIPRVAQVSYTKDIVNGPGHQRVNVICAITSKVWTKLEPDNCKCVLRFNSA